MPTVRNRDYSAPPEGIKSVSALYGWNPSATITGAENPQTGAWSSVNVTPNGNLATESAGSSTVTNAMAGILGGTGLSSGILFAANPYRVEIFGQNVSTVTPTYIKFGGQASTQSFSFILNPSATSGNGGGDFSNETFKGAVYYSGGSIVGYEV